MERGVKLWWWWKYGVRDGERREEREREGGEVSATERTVIET